MKLVPIPSIEVGPREEVVDRRGPRRAARGAERERMVLGERALAVERRRDRRARQLGELQELGGRVRVQHALAGQDHGRRGRAAPARSPRRRRPCACVSRGSAVVTLQSASPASPFSTSFATATSTGPLRYAAQRVQRPAEHLGAVRGVVQRRRIARDRAVGVLARTLRASSWTSTSCSPGSSRIGLRSPKACATAAKAASAPGPVLRDARERCARRSSRARSRRRC